MKHVPEVIQHLLENYGQVWKTSLNEHKKSIEAILYMRMEPLSTIFTQIKYFVMLEKAVKNPYSDRNLVKIAMNITRNKNYLDKVQSNWYGNTPGNQTW